MKEHRLIERAIAMLDKAVIHIEATGEVDALLIDSAVDFIVTYADKTHHGKEEDILFRELQKKQLSTEDRALMDELLVDHRFGRTATSTLAEARARYCAGETEALADITSSLRALVELYPRHIYKEDQVFFLNSRKYISDEEDQAMQTEFAKFDQAMIHRKYETVVAGLEGRAWT
jgi:hemerythrin-like domain-containing protein